LDHTEVHNDVYPSEISALLDLAPQTRAVMWLADVEGLGFEEIATQLGVSTSSARQRASRGRAEVRRRIDAGAFESPAT